MRRGVRASCIDGRDDLVRPRAREEGKKMMGFSRSDHVRCLHRLHTSTVHTDRCACGVCGVRAARAALCATVRARLPRPSVRPTEEPGRGPPAPVSVRRFSLQHLPPRRAGARTPHISGAGRLRPRPRTPTHTLRFRSLISSVPPSMTMPCLSARAASCAALLLRPAALYLPRPAPAHLTRLTRPDLQRGSSASAAAHRPPCISACICSPSARQPNLL